MRRIGDIISGFKADWNNHLIGFIATILGILIAFQLQDWQDARKESEKLAAGIESLKLELSEDNELLKKGFEQLKYFNGYTNFIIKNLNTDSTIICSVDEWDSLKQTYKGNSEIPEFVFAEAVVIKKTARNYIEIIFILPINFFPPKINTDSWEAVKSSGLLNSFPNNKLITFTRLYGELNRNHTGSTPDDFMVYIRAGNSDITKLNQITTNIQFEYEVKLWRMEESFDEIMKY